MTGNLCVCSFNVNVGRKNSIIFGNLHFGNSSFLILEMPEVSLKRHDLGLSQLLCSPGPCPYLVSTFFEIDPHPTHCLGAHSSLEDWERETVLSGTSSNKRKRLCNELTKFSFCISRQLSPVPGCTLFWGWFGMEHYLGEKQVRGLCPWWQNPHSLSGQPWEMGTWLYPSHGTQGQRPTCQSITQRVIKDKYLGVGACHKLNV